MHQVDVFNGLPPSGFILINSSRSFEELGLADFLRGFPQRHLCTVPASELALARVGRPLPNAGLLGGFAAVTGRLAFDSVATAIRRKFSGKVGDANVAAARAAYDAVLATLEREAEHA